MGGSAAGWGSSGQKEQVPRSPPEREAASFPPQAGRRAPQAPLSRWLSEHLRGRSVHWGPETHLIRALCKDSFEACGDG